MHKHTYTQVYDEDGDENQVNNTNNKENRNTNGRGFCKHLFASIFNDALLLLILTESGHY